MGRIAELYEKKALGTISEAEQKELKKLLAEAASVHKDEDGGAPAPAEEVDEDEDVDEAVDKMAKAIAEQATKRMEAGFKKMTDELKESGAVVSEVKHADGGGFIVDKSLGKRESGYKLSVAELSDIKEVVPGRENKQVKEVSARTKHFLAALMTGEKEKLQILSEGTAADGGYLVPDEFANMIVEDLRDVSVMRQIASVMSITSDTLHLPSLTSRPQANWRAEKAVKQTSTASFGETVFNPYSLASIVGLSNELVADAQLGVGSSIVNYIASLMTTALNEKEERAFFTGSGSGQPTGIVGNTGRTYAAGAGASDTQKADAIVAAYSNTPQGYRLNADWVANMGTWSEIARLKDSQNRYLLTDLASANTQLLKGRPIHEENNLAGGTAIFGDFKYYQIVDREGITVKVSDEATVAGQSAFERNLTYVRVEKRVDGKPVLPAAFTTVTGFGTP